MPTPEYRVKLSAEGVAEVVSALKKIQAESEASAKRQTKGFAQLNSVLGSTKKLLGTVGVGFGAYQIVRGINSAIDTTKQWQSEFAEVKTIATGTEVELEKVGERVRGLANIIPQDQSLLAQGYYQTLSSGITDTEEALAFLEQAAQAAVGGVTDTSIAVDVGTTIINAYGKSVSEAGRIFDVLFGTVREGKVTLAELGGSLGTVIPIAAQTGFTLEEVVAAVATLTKGGLSADEATTALRATFVSLLKPQDEALKLAKELGIEYSGQAAAAKGLVPWLKDVADKTAGNTEAQAKLFPQTRSLTAVMALAGNQWQEYSDILDTVTNKVDGASVGAFQKMTDTMAAQDQLLRNRLKNAWLDFSGTVEDVSEGTLAVIGSLLPRSFEEQTQAISRTRAELKRVDVDGKRLIETYEKLVRESDGSEESQRAIESAMKDLAAAFPEVIDQVDSMGNVTKVATDRLWEYRDALQAVLDMETRKAFQESAGEAKKYSEQLAEVSAAYNKLSDNLDRIRGGAHPADLFSDEELKALGLPKKIEIVGPDQKYTPEVTFDVQKVTDKIRQKMAQINVSLLDEQRKMAETLIRGGLAEQVVVLDSLATAVEENRKPAKQLDEALAGVGDTMRVLLDTTDPKEIREKLGLWRTALESFDPNLSFLGAEAGAALPPPEISEERKAIIGKAAAEELQLKKAGLKAEEEAAKRSYDAGLITLTAYMAKRKELLLSSTDAEIKALEDKRAAAEAEADPQKRADQLAKIDTELAKIRLEREQQILGLQDDEAKEREKLNKERLAFEEKLLEAQGRRHEIAMREIDQLVEKQRQTLIGLGVEGQQLADQLAGNRAILEARLAFTEAQADAELAVAQYQTAAGQIRDDVADGFLTQAEGHERLRELEAQRFEGLKKLVAALVAAAAATKDPEAIRAAQELIQQLDAIGKGSLVAAGGMDKFGERINGALQGGIANLLYGLDKVIDRSRSFGDLFADVTRSILDDLRRIATQLIAMQIFSGLGGLLGGGGGGVKAATGGLFYGPGDGTSDSILARVSTGEFLTRAAVVAQPGVLEHLQELNRFGRGILVPHITAMATPLPRYAEGGLVGPAPGPQAGGSLDGRLAIELADGLILKVLESPAAQRIHVKNTAANRRAMRGALGN